jgi:GMP synthase (glutamine-hydrolysing)
MKRAIILKHVAAEGPGRLAPLLAAQGYELAIRELYSGDAVPTDLSKSDLLVVMGGPMGVADVGNAEYPFLAQELALLRARIAERAPVLGICLGAQLLAAAAGARVYPMESPRYEVGWSAVRFRREHADDPLFLGLPAEAPMLHLHGDTFDLPAGAALLASSELCENQAFRLGHRLFGVQFHCEMNVQDIEGFLRADGGWVEQANGPGAVETLRRDTRARIEASHAAGDRLLSNMLQALAD